MSCSQNSLSTWLTCEALPPTPLKRNSCENIQFLFTSGSHSKQCKQSITAQEKCRQNLKSFSLQVDHAKSNVLQPMKYIYINKLHILQQLILFLFRFDDKFSKLYKKYALQLQSSSNYSSLHFFPS